MRQLLFTLLLLAPLLSDAQKTRTYPDGSTYVGSRKSGEPHGYGIYTFSTGNIHEGEFKNGVPHGQGTFTWKSGAKYVGEFNKGKFSGEGTKTWPDGRKYVGEYLNDQMHGYGIYTYPDGGKDIGEFRFGKFLGVKHSYNTDTTISSSSSAKSKIRVRISESEIGISKIAVIGKESKLCDETTDDGQSLAELVEGELIGLYGVVERKHLEDILDEQRLAMGGLVLEDTDFAQAGCLAGAQGTVLASYGCLQGKTKIQVKLVDCSTSDMYWSASGFEVSEFELLDELRVKLENR